MSTTFNNFNDEALSGVSESSIDDEHDWSLGTEAVPTVFMTVNGGKAISEAISNTPVRLGFESSRSRPPEQHTVDFVDWPFNREFTPDFDDHLEVVREEEPMYAVAPDVEGHTIDEVLGYARQLDQHADNVIVVPKEVHPSEVPNWASVGVPLANYGSDAPWQYDAYAECSQLHLLGGTPHKQLEFAQRVPNVASIDGASVVKAASCGSVWAPHHRRNWHETGDEQMDYYERVSTSLRNIVEAWEAQAAGVPADYEVPMSKEEYQEYQRAQAERDEAKEERKEQIEQERQAEVEPVQYERRARRAGRGREFIHPDDADCLTADEREMFDEIDFDERERRATERGARRGWRTTTLDHSDSRLDTSQGDLSQWAA